MMRAWKFQSYNYISKMGNCMPQVSAACRTHPSLGTLQAHSEDNKQHFKVLLEMPSQDTYIQLAKQLNKLTFSSDSKDLLYLPVKQKWKGDKSLFSGNSLQLYFQAYDQTLFEMAMNHKTNQIYSSESFLWSLAYSLAKYLKKFKFQEGKLNTLCFQNVLLKSHGSIKFVPDTLVTYLSSNGHSAAKQLVQEIELVSTATVIPRKYRCSPMYVAGIISLSVAGLLDISQLDGNNNLSWKKLSEAQKKEALKKCGFRYSKQLIEVFTDMLNTVKQPTPAQILHKIQAFRPTIQLGSQNLIEAPTLQEDNIWQKEQIYTNTREICQKKVLNDTRCLKSTQGSTIEIINIQLSEFSYQHQPELAIL